MPNKRSADQVVLTFAVSKSLVGDLDAGRTRLRGMTRSQFVRDAIAEKLRSMGIDVPETAVVPPDRTDPVVPFSRQDAAEVKNVGEQLAVAAGLALNDRDVPAPPPRESPAPSAPNRKPGQAVYPAPRKGPRPSKNPSKT